MIHHRPPLSDVIPEGWKEAGPQAGLFLFVRAPPTLRPVTRLLALAFDRARRPRKQVTLRPVHPNAGIEAGYRRALQALITEMSRSYLWFVRAQYRRNPPKLAQDSPTTDLEKELKKLGKRWQKRLDDAAPKLARYFAQPAAKRSDAVLRKILKDGGWTVQFTMTAGMRDVVDATVAENVSLIKSIASQYHTEIEGLVMRSVTAGRDLASLTDEIESRYGVSRRRAELIARDQNNKATAVFTRVRYQELGIQEAIWLHSLGGKEPRKTHIANNGKKYNIAEGWYDPDPKVQRHIWPGELINCRCVCKAVVQGFS